MNSTLHIFEVSKQRGNNHYFTHFEMQQWDRRQGATINTAVHLFETNEGEQK